MSERVRTRFAPSPTGDLHLGNARTALFAWLLARGSGGTFVLRIDDTDVERNVAGAEARILADLRWLGLTWDEGPDIGGPRGPYRQSERSSRHRETIAELLRGGAAYRCFCTPERLAAVRDAARRARRPPRYDGACAALVPAESARRAAAGEPFAVRLRRPPGPVRFVDLVRGEVVEDPADLDDFVLARADGAPLYHLATVVDDHDMGITHVVRSRDHLSNTARQLLIARAFGWPAPEYAHLSLLAEPDGRKLSKRRGGATVAALREAGHLPEAVVNDLALLGWHPGGDAPEEVFALGELAARFSLARCSTADGAADPARLRWLGGKHLAGLSDADLVRRTLEWIAAGDPAAAVRAGAEEWVPRAIVASREGAHVLAEVWEPVAALFGEPARPEDYGAPAAERAAAVRALEQAIELLESRPSWNGEAVHDALPREILRTVRLAVTGRRSGPPLHALLGALGRDSTVERLRAAIELLSGEDWRGWT
ncbi:MAG: glutamate--tRNA ligase [Deltaproteobacteria bacterium]|nr:glutamate--tRNA ligase [Deltaproteobacteria bacterium]